MDKPETYDGIYFLPGENEGEMRFSFFNMKEEDYDREPIENTKVGDKFHIAFFRMDEDGDAIFDENFEAIFADPVTYLKGFIGMELYGCVVRKTKTSGKWWDDYLNRAQERSRLTRIKKEAQAIANAKSAA